MARIRSIKIGFFRNEDLCVFGFAHRLLFEGLWLLADKAGRLEDRPKRIHADIFPFDPKLNVDAMLAELADGPNPFIRRYVVDGKRFILVLNFLKHQRPHHTEPDSTLPEPTEPHVLTSREPHGECQEPHGEAPLGKEGKGKGNEEGNGRGEEVPALRAPAPADLQALWNSLISPPIPKCQGLSEARRRHAHARLKDRPLDEWRVVIRRIEASRFCHGDNDRGWVATFDWLLQPDVGLKVLEGKYDNREKAAAGGSRTGDTVDEARASMARRMEKIAREEQHGDQYQLPSRS